jgi:hypothetical protein
MDTSADQANPSRRVSRGDTPAAKHRDIELPTLNSHIWDAGVSNTVLLRKLYEYAEGTANQAITWYWREKAPMKRASRTLRLLAIVLTTLGGLSPIVDAAGLNIRGVALAEGQVGYVLLGAAAGCVALDRFFGFSTGWMRYVKAAQEIQTSLSDFRLDWGMAMARFADTKPTPEQVQQLLHRTKAFIRRVDAQVTKETEEWISQFQASLAEADRAAAAQVAASRPGALVIMVSNGAKARDGFTIVLDGLPLQTIRGTHHQIGYVPPGVHQVGAKGEVDGRPVEATDTVNVAPGEIVEVKLEFAGVT